MISGLRIFILLISMLPSIIGLTGPDLKPGDFEKWSPEQEYTADYAVELEKTPEKDFVVLNLTDIQLSADEVFSSKGSFAYAVVDKLVKETNPDLITVTGDNAWSSLAYIQFVEEIDKYGIPWAPVMGNHDGQRCKGEAWCAKLLLDADNCLFKVGPKGMGYGNYIINITENGDIIHTIYMMDTHSDADDVKEGKINGSGYDHVWNNQIEWFKWASAGISRIAGKQVESSLFMHIPLCEYETAYNEAYDTTTGTYKGAYAETSFGVNHEPVSCPTINNGFFSVIKEAGTKNVIVGHDHINNTSILYDGVRLSYSLKCGSGCYWESEMNGGSILSIASDGSAVFSHRFIAKSEVSSGSIC